MNEVARVADRVYFYDNSVDDQMPNLLFRTVEGKLFKQYTDDIPKWAQVLKTHLQKDEK